MQISTFSLLALLKGLVKSVLPEPILANLQLWRHARAQWRRNQQDLRDARVTELKCRSMRGVRVNVGCGPNPTRGWVNLDIARDHPAVMYWDCAKGLPFNDGTVEAIYSEHFFEHLDYESEAKHFLRECLRCLKPQGTLRIVVPDAGEYLHFYAKADWSGLKAKRPLIKEGDDYRDYFLGQVYKTRMEFINAVFRQHGDHKYAYDAETLLLILREAGFSDVSETAYNISCDTKMAADTPERKTDSLYVEGKRS
jgi:predicted SAM-dependent methyltransferase